MDAEASLDSTHIHTYPHTYTHTGSPTQAGLIMDAEASLDYLLLRGDVCDPQKIFLFGRSLGGERECVCVHIYIYIYMDDLCVYVRAVCDL
jgi:hypothetical protein